MSSEIVDLEFSTPTKYKSPKTYERSKTTGSVELVFPSPSKNIATAPTSSITVSDIIDMPSPTLKRKHDEIIDIPRKKKIENNYSNKTTTN